MRTLRRCPPFCSSCLISPSCNPFAKGCSRKLIAQGAKTTTGADFLAPTNPQSLSDLRSGRFGASRTAPWRKLPPIPCLSAKGVALRADNEVMHTASASIAAAFTRRRADVLPAMRLKNRCNISYIDRFANAARCFKLAVDSDACSPRPIRRPALAGGGRRRAR